MQPRSAAVIKMNLAALKEYYLNCRPLIALSHPDVVSVSQERNDYIFENCFCLTLVGVNNFDRFMLKTRLLKSSTFSTQIG